jgi:hypothetical protein
VANGVVYLGSADGHVYAYRASGCGAPACAPLWGGVTGGGVHGAPALANGVLYVGATDGKLYAFDADGCGRATCSPLWTATTGSGGVIHQSSPAVRGGRVYIGASVGPHHDLGRLFVYQASGCGRATCAPLWRGKAGTYVQGSSPAVGGGVAYIGSGDGLLYAFSTAGCGQATCNPLWRGQMTGPQTAIQSSPTLANGVVYVGENNNQIAAFDAAGCGRPICEELWQYITQGAIVSSSPAVVNGRVYVGGSNFGITPELYVFSLRG